MSSNTDLLARRIAAIPRGVATATPIFAVRGDNARMWDAEGREYIDFAGGIAVLNTGHRHPKVVEAVRTQLEQLTHSAFQVAAYPAYIELAEQLNARVPISGEVKTICFTTGAEAVENAVKIARAATGRSAVISFTGGFHGRTALTMALTGKVSPYKRQFGPAVSDVFHVPFPIKRYGVEVDTSLLVLQHLLRADVDPARVAAIVIEPVQGEGGFHQAPRELMRALRALCDVHGIVLIADEVQSGFGRTGKLFAMDHYDVQADIVAMAKSLAGGFPLSAVSGRAELMDCVEPGGLGGTYGGSPIGCAAALAVLQVIDSEDLLNRADVLGARAKAFLAGLAHRNDVAPIDDIRGPGSMVAFDFVAERGSHVPDGAAARSATLRALDQGLILLSCGVSGETIRLLYPLTIEDSVFDEGLARLESALVGAS